MLRLADIYVEKSFEILARLRTVIDLRSNTISTKQQFTEWMGEVNRSQETEKEGFASVGPKIERATIIVRELSREECVMAMYRCTPQFAIIPNIFINWHNISYAKHLSNAILDVARVLEFFNKTATKIASDAATYASPLSKLREKYGNVTATQFLTEEMALTLEMLTLMLNLDSSTCCCRYLLARDIWKVLSKVC